MMPVHVKKHKYRKTAIFFSINRKTELKKWLEPQNRKPQRQSELYITIFRTNVQNVTKSFFYIRFFSGTEHPREDKPDLYYWAEITGQHTQTFNITDTKAINDHWPCD